MKSYTLKDKNNSLEVDDNKKGTGMPALQGGRRAAHKSHPNSRRTSSKSGEHLGAFSARTARLSICISPQHHFVRLHFHKAWARHVALNP